MGGLKMADVLRYPGEGRDPVQTRREMKRPSGREVLVACEDEEQLPFLG